MNYIHKIINFGHLFWVNLKRNFFKEILLGIGVILATVVLILGNFFGDAFETLHKVSILGKIPANEIKINGKFIKAGILSPKKIYNLKPDHINKLLKIPEIEKITPISIARFPSTLYFTINPSSKLPIIGLRKMKLFVEVPVAGIPESLVQKNHIDPEAMKNFPNGFKRHDDYIPVLLPTYVKAIIINFFKTNNLILDPMKLKSIIELELLFNHSALISNPPNQLNSSDPRLIKGKIVGFSDISITNGIAIPITELDKAKKLFLPKEQAEGVESAIIHVKEENIAKVSEMLIPYLEEWNLEFDQDVLSFRSISRYIVTAVKSFRLAVNIFSALILLLSFLAVFYAFLYLIIRRGKEIGLYRFFGGTKVEIMSILILESALIGGLCATIGFLFCHYVLTSYLPEHFADFIKLLPTAIIDIIFPTDIDINQYKHKLFLFDYSQNIYYALISGLSCVIAAFIPAIIGSSVSLFRSIQQD